MLKSSSDNRTIKETCFTGPIVFLSVNVRGPVYFAVSAKCHFVLVHSVVDMFELSGGLLIKLSSALASLC